jgi:solute carrier family 25 phosphate transporter 23/24/25/41
MPESAFKFGVYEASKRFFARIEGRSDPKQISWYFNFVAGGLGGMASQYAFFIQLEQHN